MASTQNIKELHGEVFEKVHEHTGSMVQFSERITQVTKKLETLSQDMIAFVDKGDFSDEKRISHLWHELNNVNHVIRMIPQLIDSASSSLEKECEKLIEALTEIRPK